MSFELLTPGGAAMVTFGVLGAVLALIALLRRRRGLAVAALVCGLVSVTLGAIGTWTQDRVAASIAEPAQLSAAQHEALRATSHGEALGWTFIGLALGGPAIGMALGAIYRTRAR